MDPVTTTDGSAGSSVLIEERTRQAELEQEIYEPLVIRDTRGKVRPALATRWHVTDDPRIWVFELRPGVTFHDGTPLRAEDVVFSIEDNGVGIPEDQFGRIFDRFESFSQGSKHRGAGLGLSIVKSLVELQQKAL